MKEAIGHLFSGIRTCDIGSIDGEIAYFRENFTLLWSLFKGFLAMKTTWG